MPKPPRAPTRRRYTPALKADGKRRYEKTDEQTSLIAADFGIHPGSFWRLAKREGWVRYVPPPRDISSAAKLQVQAEALEQALHPTPDAAREAGPSPHPGSHRTAMLADPPPPGEGEGPAPTPPPAPAASPPAKYRAAAARA